MSSINRKTLLLGSVAIPMSMLAAQPAVAQDNTEAAEESGYAKIDAHIGVEFDRFELRVFGRNLTNKATYTASVDAPLSPGVYVGWIEEPRVIGFEGKINF